MTKASASTSNADPKNGAARARVALLYQLLETEMGGVQVYRTALQCALNADLRTEWTKYLAQTERHVVIARDLLDKLGLDPDAEIPARVICRHDGEALVNAMLEALASGTPPEAQLVAAECVVKAETKDHLNWSLLSLLAKKGQGGQSDVMKAACDLVEKEEDHHVYHAAGWARELWAEALGLPAALPPPEEARDVETMAEAADAKADRDTMTERSK